MPGSGDGGGGGRPIVYTRSRKTKDHRTKRTSTATTINTDDGSSTAKKKVSNKKKKFDKNVRFHGAFTGGFSAGYFNSVGSKEGWTPNDHHNDDDDDDNDSNGGIGMMPMSSKRKRPRKQRVEDFMDDQDANDWGGPMGVRSDYIGGDGDVVDNEEEEEDETDFKRRRRKNGGVGGGGSDGSVVPSASSLRQIATSTTIQPKKVTTITDNDATTNDNDTNGMTDMEFLQNALIPQHRKRQRQSPLDSMDRKDTIGKRLLRSLGWNDHTLLTSSKNNNDNTTTSTTSYAYIPIQDDDNDDDNPNSTTNKTSIKHKTLSQKKIRRITLQLQSQRPPPPSKIDSYGIGHLPYENAPEFAAHRETRRKRAEARVRGVLGNDRGGKGRTNVYRTSDLYDDCEEEIEELGERGGGRGGGTRGGGGTGGVMAQETTEDFVGTHTVGGFALHDDDDDVYDDNDNTMNGGGEDRRRGIDAATTGTGSISTTISKVGRGGGIMDFIKKSGVYDTEIYEASDDDSAIDDDANPFMGGKRNNGSHKERRRKDTNNNNNTTTTTKNQSGDFAGALNAWASGTTAPTTTPNNTKNEATTSDGQIPLSGFHLGGNTLISVNTQKRWPGPEVPLRYNLLRHVFREGDAVEKMKELSSAMMRSQRWQRNAGKGLGKDMNGGDGSKNTPLGGTAFLRLSDALKQRFTTSGTTATTIIKNTPQSGTSGEGKNLKSTRTIVAWQPSPLVCKRFCVTTALVAKGCGNGATSAGSNLTKSNRVGGKEEEFFHNLSSSLGANPGGGGSCGNGAISTRGLIPLSNDNGISSVPRPSMEMMKSIFEPDSEEDDNMDISSDDEEEEEEEDVEKCTDARARLLSSLQTLKREKDGGIDDGVVPATATTVDEEGHKHAVVVGTHPATADIDVNVDGDRETAVIIRSKGHDDLKLEEEDNLPSTTASDIVDDNDNPPQSPPSKSRRQRRRTAMKDGSDHHRHRSRSRRDLDDRSIDSSSSDSRRRRTKKKKKKKSHDKRRRRKVEDDDSSSSSIQDDDNRQYSSRRCSNSMDPKRHHRKRRHHCRRKGGDDDDNEAHT